MTQNLSSINLDPHTGAFRPVPSAAEEGPDAAAPTTFTVTITVTLTITLKTTALTNITCSEEVSVVSEEVSVVDGTTSLRLFAESNTVAATGTGTTRTCKLSIPNSWGLTTQASNNMSTSSVVFGSTGTTGLAQRTSTLSPLDTRKVLASGTTTALTAAVPSKHRAGLEYDPPFFCSQDVFSNAPSLALHLAWGDTRPCSHLSARV
jgi:copper chaperone CopZ